MTLILNNDDVKKALDKEECLQAMDEAYHELPVGRAANRPTSHIYTAHSLPQATYSFKSVEGAVQKFGILALRITSDIVREEQHGGSTRLEKLPLATAGLPGSSVYLEPEPLLFVEAKREHRVPRTSSRLV